MKIKPTFTYVRKTKKQMEETEKKLASIEGNRIFIIYQKQEKSLVNARTKRGRNNEKLKTPEDKKGIVKLCWMEAYVGDYETLVNKVRRKEGKYSDFQAGTGHLTVISKNSVVYQNKKGTKKYAMLFFGDFLSGLNPNSKHFLSDGAELSPHEWRNIQSEYYELRKTTNQDTHGTEAKICVLTPKMEDILYFSELEVERKKVNDLASNAYSAILENLRQDVPDNILKLIESDLLTAFKKKYITRI